MLSLPFDNECDLVTEIHECLQYKRTLQYEYSA